MSANTLTKARAKTYLKALQSCKKKTMSVAELAFKVGIFEDVIRDQFATFDPMIRMLEDVDLLEYVDQLTNYIEVSKTKKVIMKKGTKTPYKNIGDFVYQNMTIPGGIVDASIDLTFDQIKILKKLVNQEYKIKKPKK